MWTDITCELTGKLPSWPDTQERILTLKHCNNIISSDLTFHLHYGTHIDAPLHFIPEGKTVFDLNINDLCGEVEVVEITDTRITAKLVKPLRSSIIFFKTSIQPITQFTPNYPYITKEAAEMLVSNNVKIVGTDHPSIENFHDKSFPAHKILLSNNIIIVELIKLYQTSPGKYKTMIIPLPIKAEASPARVLISPI
jgi:arylformamidase